MESPRKIALEGTCCVGKSSVFNKLKKDLEAPNKVFIEEVARKYLIKNRIDSEKIDLQIQEEMQDWIIEEETKAHSSNPDLIVCDRSVICSIPYLLALGEKEAAHKLYERVKDWADTYSLFVLLDPRGVPYIQDKVRRESPEYRLKIHDSYLEFLESIRAPYVLIGGNLEERINKIKNYL